MSGCLVWLAKFGAKVALLCIIIWIACIVGIVYMNETGG